VVKGDADGIQHPPALGGRFCLGSHHLRIAHLTVQPQLSGCDERLLNEEALLTSAVSPSANSEPS
jgi:hypothetical protein